MTRGARAAALFVAVLVTGAWPRPALAGQDAPLTPLEMDALRAAILRVGEEGLRSLGPEALVDALESGAPGLDADSLQHLQVALRRDGYLMGEIVTYLRREGNALRLETAGLQFSWRPSMGPDAGQHSGPPTPEQAARLGRVLASARDHFGVPTALALPYHLDPGVEHSRAWPRSDIHWGVLAASADDARAVVAAVLLEVGDAPGLLEPLALLHGTCHGDESCWDAIVERALAAASAQGLASVDEALAAGTLSGPDDPAFVTGVLLTDELHRRHPVSSAAALLRQVRLDTGAAGRRAAVIAVLRTTPDRLDRALHRRIREQPSDRRP